MQCTHGDLTFALRASSRGVIDEDMVVSGLTNAGDAMRRHIHSFAFDSGHLVKPCLSFEASITHSP